MSQAQEQRRRDSWENGGREAFEPTFEKLRNLENQIAKFPEGSEERAAKQKEYDDYYEAALKEHEKATDF